VHYNSIIGHFIPYKSSFILLFITTIPLVYTVHSQISSAYKKPQQPSILNVNRVQTNIRTEVVQILGRNPMKTLIKRPFLVLSAVTMKPMEKPVFIAPIGP
jgi:hypothetical protein